MKYAMIFPGQGAQRPGMGKDVCDKYIAAKRIFNEADEALGFSLSDIIFNGTPEQLAHTEITQPAILTVSVAMFRALEQELGTAVEPVCMAGHSLFYKTVWGLRLRAVGQFEEAAKTAGIKVNAVKYQAIFIAGLIGGLAGAHLSLGYSTQFTENMTSNRGFMGVAAMYFGGANPVFTALGCLLFGFADSVGSRLQAYGIPSQFVLMMPYIVTVVVLSISMIVKLSMSKKRQSSLT